MANKYILSKNSVKKQDIYIQTAFSQNVIIYSNKLLQEIHHEIRSISRTKISRNNFLWYRISKCRKYTLPYCIIS